MVLREVREDRRREVRSRRRAQLERVRGDLHRARAVAAVEHRAEVALQVDRLGRRARDRALAPADDRLDRAEQPALLAGGLEQRAHQVGRRRLAVGARDADDAQLARRVAEEARGERRHRRARRGDEHLRHAEPERALDDQRRRAARDRLRREVVPVAAESRATQKNSSPPRTARLS